ncbi:MAG: YbhB/YbcL family Raf kinase inhibitor-like protein [Pseudomonas sp.]
MNILKRSIPTMLAGLALANGVSALELLSPDLQQGKALGQRQEFNGFGCTGPNISPALSWKDAPAGTRSFAITLYDPDAPTGSGWWHWMLFDLPATTQHLQAGASSGAGKGLPAGSIQSLTDFGAPGFGGACPPAGDPAHRYVLTLHALKTPRLELGADAMPALVGFMLKANSLATASITATYARPATP